MEHNNLDSLKERLAFRKDGLDSIVNGLGTPDSLTIDFFDRKIVVVFEEPGSSTEVMAAIKKYLNDQVTAFEKHVADGEVLVKEFAEAKAKADAELAARKAQEDAEEKAKQDAAAQAAAEAEAKRMAQEEQLRLATIAQEEEKAKQESLKTKILEAELASKTAQ
jgi:hypothetical protein